MALYSETEGYLSTLIKTKSRDPDGVRLKHIFNEFTRIVKGKNVQMACMEGPSYHSVNKSFSMGEAYGVFKLCCSILDIPLVIVPPTKIKKYISGSGHASKSKVISSCNSVLGITTASDDIADAIACCTIARELGASEVVNIPKTRAALEVVTSIVSSLPS